MKFKRPYSFSFGILFLSFGVFVSAGALISSFWIDADSRNVLTAIGVIFGVAGALKLGGSIEGSYPKEKSSVLKESASKHLKNVFSEFVPNC